MITGLIINVLIAIVFLKIGYMMGHIDGNTQGYKKGFGHGVNELTHKIIRTLRRKQVDDTNIKTFFKEIDKTK